MKTSKLTKTTWVFVALTLTTTTLFAQGWRNGNRLVSGQNNCIYQVSGLSDEQITRIDGLNNTHQAKMGELRTQRRSTIDAVEKSEIRTTMLKNVKAHRDEVKSLLTAEQQKEFDLLQQCGNYRNGRGNAYFQGRGQGWGQQFVGYQGCRARANRVGYGQGYGRGNR